MVMENIIPITYMQERCTIRDSYKLSWLGRIVATNMVLLPKLVFVFLNAVLDSPNTILSKMQAIINEFIWRSKKPRIRLRMVEQKLQNGGVAIPNIYKKIIMRPC